MKKKAAETFSAILIRIRTAAGLSVPAEVLADYPDLAAKYGKGNQ